jgi:murein L,D-transpeptidase YafK
MVEHSRDDRVTFSRLQVQQRRTTVARLYLQQRTQAEIACAVSVNQGTVSRDLKAIQAEWQRQRLDDFTQAKQRELARIDQVEREYWEAWERSCQDREQTPQEKTRHPRETA